MTDITIRIKVRDWGRFETPKQRRRLIAMLRADLVDICDRTVSGNYDITAEIDSGENA